MARKIENLKDLFLERGRELYEAALQEQKELPGIQKESSNSELKEIINRELNSALKQSSRLNDVFNQFNLKPTGEKDNCCQSILKESKRLIGKTKEHWVRDAAIIESIQRLNHNNITSLGSLATYAMEIGESKIAGSLHEMLLEEKDIDKQLSSLAKEKINKKAAILA